MNNIPKEWAKENAMAEAEAFDWAVRTCSIEKEDFNIDEAYKRLVIENAELKDTIRQQAERINRLCETVKRRSDNEWD